MEIYGLFGETLGHSLSPEIFKILFKMFNIKGSYNLFEITKDNFKNAVNSAKVLNVKGVSVTIPYKEDVISQLDILDSSVEKIGACNCVKFDDGLAYGYNTDYYGYGDSLKLNGVFVEGKDVVVLGDGGAAKSIIQYFKDENAKSITIVSRKKYNSDDEKIKIIGYDELSNIEKSYLVVNTTPIGMYPNVDKSIISNDILSKFSVASDIVYNPLETLFLQKSREEGLICVNGLYMLVGQAICAWKIFTGLEVTNEEFKTIYNEVELILKSKI